MGITYIPNDPSFNVGLQGIVKGVHKLIDPNYEFREGMKKLIATNPQLAQQLSDLENKSPGTLASLGMGDLSQTIADIGPSNQRRIEQAAAPAIQAALNQPDIISALGTLGVLGKTPDELAAEKAQGELARSTLEQMHDPSVRKAAGVKGATGKTPGDLKKDEFDSQILAKAIDMYRNGPEITLDKFLNNEYTNEDLMTIFSTPLGAALREQLDLYKANLQISASRSARREERSDALERQNVAEAFNLLSKLKDPKIKLDAVYKYLHNKDRVGGRNVSNEEMANIPTAIQRLQDEDLRQEVSAYNKDVINAIQQFRTIDENKLNKNEAEALRQLLATQMNDALQKRSKFGLPAYSVAYEKIVRKFLPDGTKLVFRDPSGNEVAEGVAIAGLPPLPVNEKAEKPISNEQWDKAISKAMSQVLSAKDRKAAMRVLSEKNPALFEAVKQRIGEQ
jgi:hypothetical protein